MGLFDSFFGKKRGSSPTKKGDGSPPAAEPGIEAAESAMPNVKKELESGIPALKPAEVNDRSAPVVESATIKKSPMSSLQSELKDKSAEYRQAEAAREVLADVAKRKSVDLKPVDGAVDRSAPVIESDVHLKMNPMADLTKEIAGSTPELKHVDETADRSAPVVEMGVKLKESPMAALQKEIADKKDEITGFATIGAQRVAAKDMLGEIEKRKSVELKHVDEAADRSAPIIEGEESDARSQQGDCRQEGRDRIVRRHRWRQGCQGGGGGRDYHRPIRPEARRRGC